LVGEAAQRAISLLPESFENWQRAINICRTLRHLGGITNVTNGFSAQAGAVEVTVKQAKKTEYDI
jgi:hypothetical protein